MNGVLKDKKAFAVFLLPGLLFYLFSVFYPVVIDSVKYNENGMESEHLNLSVLEITQSCLEISVLSGISKQSDLSGNRRSDAAYDRLCICSPSDLYEKRRLSCKDSLLCPVHYHHGGSDTAVPKYLFHTAAGIVKWGAGSCWAWKSGYFLAEQHKNGIDLCLCSGGMALYRNVHGNFLCGIDLTRSGGLRSCEGRWCK